MATFNILGFNQKALLEIQEEKQINLNGNDLIVLRNMVDMIDSNRLVNKIIKDKKYTWIKYSLLVENLLIVSNKEDTFKKIVTKLIKCGLLERVVLKSIGNGAFTYFRKTSVLESIIYLPEKQDTLKKKSGIKNRSAKYSEDKLKSQVYSEKNDKQCIEERLIAETGVSKERVNEAINYALKRNAKNVFSYARDTIKNNWYSLNNKAYRCDYNDNKVIGFNNFQARKYDYETLERKLLGWETEDDKEKRLVDLVML